MLTAKDRITLSTSPVHWMSRTLATPGVRLSGMGPEILIAASFLPPPLHRDPADRILAATARHYDLTLMTRDARLLAYAQAGHLRTLAC